MEIVGVDIGNITSIACNHDKINIIESRIKDFNVYDTLNSNDVMTIGDKKIVLGQGSFENEYVKHEKENFLNLLFYSISKVVDKKTKEVNLVTSIPAGQYELRYELEKYILENNHKKFKINDVQYDIMIEEVMVVPEGYPLKASGTFSECEKGNMIIVIDIGGGSTDIAIFDGNKNFVKGEYIRTGLLDLYREVKNVLDSKYRLQVTIEEAKLYFDGDLNLLNKDVSYKQEIMLNFIKKIVNELRGMYPDLMNSNIILTGGGATKVYKTFKNLYPQTIQVNDIKANAVGNYKIGVKKWQSKNTLE